MGQAPTTHTIKAAKLFILYRLKQARLLEDMTYADIGRLLGCDRSTAYRLMQSLKEAEAMMVDLIKSARIKSETSTTSGKTVDQENAQDK